MIIDQLITHMQSGRPLTPLSAHQVYGVVDLPRAILTIRFRGYHVRQTQTTTVCKYTGLPKITTEYRMEAR